MRAEFIRKVDAVGKGGMHPLRRITGAFRVLSYDHSYNPVDEVVEESDISIAKTVKTFCAAVLEGFGDEYLRGPSEENLLRIISINESRGFSGYLGSLDCQHWE